MSPKNSKDGTLVFSTEQGRNCPACRQPLALCSCSKKPVVASSDGIVRVGRETKGRKGKGVTLVTGLPLGPEEMKKMALSLKKRCGCGGAVKDGVIEIQGDHRDMLLADLAAMGYKVKRAGG
ncbi:MAG: translation initiation factor Sui1 [Desulfobulbaceae bacterium]